MLCEAEPEGIVRRVIEPALECRSSYHLHRGVSSRLRPVVDSVFALTAVALTYLLAVGQAPALRPRLRSIRFVAGFRLISHRPYTLSHIRISASSAARFLPASFSNSPPTKLSRL